MAALSPPTSYRGYVEDSVYGTWLVDALEHVPDLVYPLSVPTYSRMRKEPVLAAVLAAYTLPMRRATWAVDPAGCREEVARQVADDIGLPVAGMDQPGAARVRGVSWAEHLRTALLHLVWGHYGHEMLAEVVDGRARLIGLSDRMPSTLSNIHVSDQGVLLGVSQDMRGFDDPPQIKADRLVWYCHEREGSAWYGQSLLRPAFGPWLLKQELVRVAATSSRRFGMGVPTVRALPGTTPTPGQMAEAAALAQSARVGDQGGAAIPPGFVMELLGLSGGVPDTLGLIRYMDQQMSRMALAGFLDLGTTETGARALGEAFIDLFTLSTQAAADYVADVVTRQVAARIVAWNWGTDEPVPRVTVADVGSKHEVTADAIEQLMRSGAITADPQLEAWVRRAYRLPQRDRATPVAPPEVPADTRPATQPVTASRRGRRSPVPEGQLELPIAAASPADVRLAEAEAFQADWESAKTDTLAEWPDLAAPMVDELAAQAADATGRDDLVALAALVAPPAMVAAVAAALSAAMLSLAASAAGHVVASAAAHGVSISAPADAGVDRIGQVAQATAQLLATRYAAAAAAKAMLLAGSAADPQAVLDAVKTHLNDLATSGAGMVADAVGGALSTAQAAGRRAVYAAHPPKRLVAVEINDKNTCLPCEELDGAAFATLAEAEAAYPVAGFVGCLGGLRCRGHLHAVWE